MSTRFGLTCSDILSFPHGGLLYGELTFHYIIIGTIVYNVVLQSIRMCSEQV